MYNLYSKEPSYVRCIKPNQEKISGLISKNIIFTQKYIKSIILTNQKGSFNNEQVSHQVNYLSLMENLRVRRAGYAYRRKYDLFLKRYKSLCPTTWPSYTNGDDRSGTQEICAHLALVQGEDYSLGK
jgi:myosin-1